MCCVDGCSFVSWCFLWIRWSGVGKILRLVVCCLFVGLFGLV